MVVDVTTCVACTGWGLPSAFGTLCTTLRPMHVPTLRSSCSFHVPGCVRVVLCLWLITPSTQVVFFALLLPLVFFLCFEVRDEY